MKIKLVKYLLLVVVFLMKSIDSQSQQPAIVSNFSQFSGFNNASISIYAVDVNSKDVLIDYESNRLLAPASTAKLFSTALALDVLGPKYQPTTSIYYDGIISDSILSGDIWIIGGGDMSLGSKYFNSTSRDEFLKDWVRAINKSGIKQIKGNIYVDGSDFGYEGVPDDWLWGDIGNYYGAQFTGAMIYDNILEYHFKTNASGSPTELISIFPEVDSLHFKNNILSSTRGGDNSYIFGAPYSNYREGRGTLPQNVTDFVVKGSLPDPELQLAKEVSRVLNQTNINHIGAFQSTRLISILRPINTWKKIIDYKGKSILELVKVTNFESVNIFAEGMMRLVAYEKEIGGTNAVASEYMQDYWKRKLGIDYLFLSDGSGLARTNAVTTKTFCNLLTYMNFSKNGNEFYASLPVSGVSGTLKNVAKNQAAQGMIHAKSGTMRRVKSYAGYAEAKSGRRIAFAVIVNNYTCTNKEATQRMEELMNELIKF